MYPFIFYHSIKKTVITRQNVDNNVSYEIYNTGREGLLNGMKMLFIVHQFTFLWLALSF